MRDRVLQCSYDVFVRITVVDCLVLRKRGSVHGYGRFCENFDVGHGYLVYALDFSSFLECSAHTS